MIKKMCCVMLVVLIVCSSAQVSPAYGQGATKYKAREQIDPVEVRKVVTGFDIGDKIKLQMESGLRFDGKIQTIEWNSFTIIESKTGKPKVVDFAEVKELQKKKFPAWAKVVIVVGGIIGILFGAMYAECGSGGCH